MITSGGGPTDVINFSFKALQGYSRRIVVVRPRTDSAYITEKTILETLGWTQCTVLPSDVLAMTSFAAFHHRDHFRHAVMVDLGDSYSSISVVSNGACILSRQFDITGAILNSHLKQFLLSNSRSHFIDVHLRRMKIATATVPLDFDQSMRSYGHSGYQDDPDCFLSLLPLDVMRSIQQQLSLPWTKTSFANLGSRWEGLGWPLDPKLAKNVPEVLILREDMAVPKDPDGQPHSPIILKFQHSPTPTLAWGDPTLPSALRRFTSEFGGGPT
eukprot:TRINITY_DN8097_c0_g1_i2.p1 TRINITY_DN8097_c0_g1~~TRINITY_DN8097_c0_g1_i2.p1  ORF type:complete len:271 (-),score=29.47 TRINITY_DN8097_c0_g1_i2:14-826(-)